MAVDYFLKIDGIPGESNDAKHKDEIDVLSFSFGITTGAAASEKKGAAGKVRVADFSIVHFVDKASPLLFEAACKGEHIPEAMFTARKAGERPLEYLKIKLTEVQISGVTPAGTSGGDLPMESLSLNFSKVEWTYIPQRPDGSGGPPVHSFCIKEGKE